MNQNNNSSFTLKNFNWRSSRKTSRILAFMLAAAAVISGIVTVTALTGSRAGAGDPKTVVHLLYLDGILMLLLSAVIGRRIIRIWRERRSGIAGARLQSKLVSLFAAVAIAPAILVAVFSALFLHFGIEAWFSKRVGGALNQSIAVTGAYFQEHRQNIQTEAFAIANDLNRKAPYLMQNQWEFNRTLSAHAGLRSLSEAIVIDRSGQMLARSEFSLLKTLEVIPTEIFKKADEKGIALINSEIEDQVRALVRLNRFINAYLLIERFIDPRVIQHIDKIQKTVNEYNDLKEERIGIQVSFVVIYIIATILLLLAAVWIGLTVTAQLATPISDLIEAADQVSKGDLSTQIENTVAHDEIGRLGKAFNHMTNRIAAQQHKLVDANRELDERRRFTETVLSGVSAGVIGLDSRGQINLPNRSASVLLETDLNAKQNIILGDAIPEMKSLLETAQSLPERMHEKEITIQRNGKQKTLITRITAEYFKKNLVGFVVTFDDITALLLAQRKAAWSDVARRIAHEIKNPLTPIQLSAERLNRRYQSEIKTDPENFDKCVNTIIRQVEEIGQLVDEFSSFARMPQPIMKVENFSEICRHIMFTEKNRTTSINYELNLPDKDIFFDCDRKQISRALVNLLKNAAESIVDSKLDTKTNCNSGLVTLTAAKENKSLKIYVEDNGNGLPDINPERLLEPYITTREEGTGLGLAIVKKILDDHNGQLTLENRLEEGTRATLIFNKITNI